MSFFTAEQTHFFLIKDCRSGDLSWNKRAGSVLIHYSAEYLLHSEVILVRQQQLPSVTFEYSSVESENNIQHMDPTGPRRNLDPSQLSAGGQVAAQTGENG